MIKKMKNPKLKNVDSKATIRRLLRYIKPQIPLVALSTALAALYVALTLLAPVLIGRAVDSIVGPGDVDYAALPAVFVSLVVCVLLAAVFNRAMILCNNKISYRTAENLRRDSFAKLETIPLSYIDSASQGDLITRIVSDVDTIADGLLQGTSQFFVGIATIVGTIIFMFALNWLIALVVIVLTPLSIFVASFIAKRIHSTFKENSAVAGELGGYTDEIIRNKNLVTAFDYSARAEARYKEINGRLQKCGVRSQLFSSLTNPSTRFVNGLVYTSAGVCGALLAVLGPAGAVTVGEISAFLSYANQYTKPFNEITGVFTQLQSAVASASRVFELLDVRDETDDGTENIGADVPDVAFDDVSFSYSPDRRLIENVAIDVKYGETVAIVGPTGCGKTTLINLLMRFYDVDSGRITVGGVDVRNMKRSELRSHFGMVLQDSWLFEGTIRDNIAYAKPEATDAEIERAARDAHVHSFIEKLPLGYDTVIGTDGEGISAGQKQLLCIARVMLVMPPILILDEATSSIDTMTERRIQKAFAKMTEGRTSFIVAHRLSTISGADLILVMRDGNIVEQGKHERLLASGGFYAQLWNSRKDAGEPA